jgi:hypothetical protein
LDCSVSQIQAGHSFFLKLAVQPLFLYTIFWTLMITTTVTVLALSLKVGFSSSISASMEIIEACSLQWNKASLACRQCFLLLLDGTHDGRRVPTKLFKKSRIDITMHLILAAFVVAVAALFGPEFWDCGITSY